MAVALRYKRGWFYHKEHRMWYIRVPNMEPLVKTNTYERGSYHCFDPSTFETVRRVSFLNTLPSFFCYVIYLQSNCPVYASNGQTSCRIILFFIMKWWKRDRLYRNIKEHIANLQCKAFYV